MIRLFLTASICLFAQAIFSQPQTKADQPHWHHYQSDADSAYRIFSETFHNNDNAWDLYANEKSWAAIQDGALVLESFANEGTSRCISLPFQYADFSLEARINIEKLSNAVPAGLVYGFKDWQNYHYFLITATSYYLGSVQEGVSTILVQNRLSNSIKANTFNTIKVVSHYDKNIYFINGEAQCDGVKTPIFGNKIGFVISGKSKITATRLLYKNAHILVEEQPSQAPLTPVDTNTKTDCSGFLFNKKGYIITSSQAIQNAQEIWVDLRVNGVLKTYRAAMVQKDDENGIAILKIKDLTYTKNSSMLSYSTKEVGINVGSRVFSLKGAELGVKKSEGVISSKTGYENSINSYQTSILASAAGRGAPLFNEKGQLIGMMSDEKRDKVSYAVKIAYIKALVDLLPEAVELPENNGLQSENTEEKIKNLAEYIVLVRVK
ncbi:MAG: trypsin-like peptidase domain-containing protein [Bacteroidetes bacterium]|nr:trypsin-like peptidase domain-containing protein [Bacteroidota bacterium]